ncbi:unnamed protein product [Hydatigera taeniaeformis]|uniref:Centromere protein X n=1 Tax=Hydatigena taeniaeformis TaxID=6205 RepID=A0A0R3X732_HYDTA|nr:unnamed protein product [Hydatigera taeniaeformis]
MSIVLVPDSISSNLLNGIKGDSQMRLHLFSCRLLSSVFYFQCSHLLTVALSDALKRTQNNTVSDQALVHALEVLFEIV